MGGTADITIKQDFNEEHPPMEPFLAERLVDHIIREAEFNKRVFSFR